MKVWVAIFVIGLALILVEWLTYRRLDRRIAQQDAARRRHTGKTRL